MITNEKLLSYLESQLSVDVGGIGTDTELFTGGVLDSFSVVELVLFIEGEEKIKMQPTELVMDNLDSIAKILRFCETKRAAALSA